MIPELVNQYAEFAIQVKNSQTLGEPVKAQIMLQMAQALSSLVPLAGGQQDQIVQQQHQMDLEKQKHVQQMQMAQQKHDQAMQIQLEKHQAEQQKAAQNHQMGLVQKEQQHQIALKQKAQQKPEVKNNGK
jgi:hypothetical protein